MCEKNYIFVWPKLNFRVKRLYGGRAGMPTLSENIVTDTLLKLPRVMVLFAFLLYIFSVLFAKSRYKLVNFLFVYLWLKYFSLLLFFNLFRCNSLLYLKLWINNNIKIHVNWSNQIESVWEDVLKKGTKPKLRA